MRKLRKKQDVPKLLVGVCVNGVGKITISTSFEYFIYLIFFFYIYVAGFVIQFSTAPWQLFKFGQVGSTSVGQTLEYVCFDKDTE